MDLHRFYIVSHVPQSILDEIGYYRLQQRAAQLQARIRIHFDQVRNILIINHKIKAEQLEIMVLSLFIQQVICTSNSISRDTSHFGKDLLEKIDASTFVLFLRYLRDIFI